MQKQLIDSAWKLYYFPQYERKVSLDDLKQMTPIDATVPGNVELDLIREGLLKKTF